jgi:hypothetical protein
MSTDRPRAPWTVSTSVVALVLATALLLGPGTASAAEPAVEPCGPFGGAIVENWARPATPAEQARVAALRQACRRTQRARSTAARTQYRRGASHRP